LKSPTATETGFVPAPTVELVGNSPAPSPKRIVTLPEIPEILGFPLLATARAGLPSPLKCPTATDSGEGPAPTGEPGAGAEPARRLPERMVTLLFNKLATARSGLPSPLKSPTATD